ncbi:hypothetical protein EON63_11695 [archaeon]|nr:MAG: hypothetical protein EON63_11695 [archaeon]
MYIHRQRPRQKPPLAHQQWQTPRWIASSSVWLYGCGYVHGCTYGCICMCIFMSVCVLVQVLLCI